MKPDPARATSVAIGLRSTEVFKFLPAGARPARCSKTGGLSEVVETTTVFARKYRRRTSSRPTLPPKGEAHMSKVFILDTNKQPLNPVHHGRARILLSTGQAAVFKWRPFTLILKYAVETPRIEPLRVKIDPGSKTTGLAVVNDASGEVVAAFHLEHRAQRIADAMKSRISIRRGRRSRSTRYRKARFLNRKASHKKGVKQPCLNSRVCNVETWVKRLMRLCPVTALSMELVKFDTQVMENPEISGVEYQQGELQGYEVKEYLLEKWGRVCVYCGKKDTPLEVEHIVPRSKGGSDRVSNLTIACGPCNIKKGALGIKDFLKGKPGLVASVLAQAKAPLKDAAAVNSTR